MIWVRTDYGDLFKIDPTEKQGKRFLVRRDVDALIGDEARQAMVLHSKEEIQIAGLDQVSWARFHDSSAFLFAALAGDVVGVVTETTLHVVDLHTGVRRALPHPKLDRQAVILEGAMTSTAVWLTIIGDDTSQLWRLGLDGTIKELPRTKQCEQKDLLRCMNVWRLRRDADCVVALASRFHAATSTIFRVCDDTPNTILATKLLEVSDLGFAHGTLTYLTEKGLMIGDRLTPLPPSRHRLCGIEFSDGAGWSVYRAVHELQLASAAD